MKMKRAICHALLYVAILTPAVLFVGAVPPFEAFLIGALAGQLVSRVVDWLLTPAKPAEPAELTYHLVYQAPEMQGNPFELDKDFWTSIDDGENAGKPFWYYGKYHGQN